MTLTALESLQPYVPRLVHGWQTSHPDVTWREIEGSMVFADVSGFTSMSERLARHGRVGAEEVTEVIGRTFESLLEGAYFYGGSLLKFGGDALLLFFEGEQHPTRAVAAASSMRARLREASTFTTTAGKVTLRMSVGGHTGTFHLFLTGDSHRELIVAGPAATELVAMEASASTGQILLSPALAAAVPKRNRGRETGQGVLLAGRVEADRFGIESIAPGGDLTAFIPLALREAVMDGGVDPDHRPVTVAFIHFSHFDHAVADSGGEEAARALDDLVRSVQHAVDARGLTFLGTDIASDGGKIILAAGAPNVSGNDEELMLLALREIVSSEHSLPLEIGVARGHVFAGEIGPFYRRTYTVMGDSVNLAARLMARAGPDQILTTPEVLAGSRTLFETSELEAFLVKGKKHPVQAHAVGEPRGSRATMAEVGLPLIGRDAELQVLMDAWESARAGTGRLVEVSAEAGMGKSRLLQEFLLQLSDARLLSGECRLYQSTTPYFPFAALMRQALGLEGLDDEGTVAGLEQAVRSKASYLAPWLPLIGVPLGLSIPESDEVAMLDDQFRRTRLEEAVDRLLAALVTDPAVIVVEDTHWMDEASRDLLNRIAGSVAERPWLIVISHRPGDDGFVTADDASAVIGLALEPLGTEQAEALINTATGDSPLMPQQVRSLAQRAQGSPLILIELLDALRRGEDVESLPHSVEGLIQARIDRLPPADRILLRHLSVLGVGFQEEHITSVLPPTTGIETRPILQRLADFMAIPRDGWVQFRHALIANHLAKAWLRYFKSAHHFRRRGNLATDNWHKTCGAAAPSSRFAVVTATASSNPGVSTAR